MFGSFFSIIIFLVSCVNYEKHALRVSRVIAVLAKSACKHAIFLATRVKKRESIKDSPERGDNQIRTGDKGVADPCLTTWLRRHIFNCVNSHSYSLPKLCVSVKREFTVFSPAFYLFFAYSFLNPFAFFS